MLPARLRAALADPRRWKRWGIEALIFIAIVVAIHLWQTRGLPQGPAPTLAGTLADGRAASLAETLKAAGGRPVLVVFWATWCPICKAEEGTLAAIASDWPVLTVAMRSGDRMAVAKHLHERELRYPALIDNDGSMAFDWAVRGVPTHFIIDRHGQIRHTAVGYTTSLGLRARLWWLAQEN